MPPDVAATPIIDDIATLMQIIFRRLMPYAALIYAAASHYAMILMRYICCHARYMLRHVIRSTMSSRRLITLAFAAYVFAAL